MSGALSALLLLVGCDQNGSEPTYLELGLPAKILFDEQSLEIVVGESYQLHAICVDEHDLILPDSLFTWSSDDHQIATINSDGLLTASTPGTTLIYALYANISSAPLVVSVPENVAFIAINSEDSLLVEKGGSVNLTGVAVAFDGAQINGVNFNWHCSNEAVASVSNSGTVNGADYGIANISITLREATSDPIFLRVDDPPSKKVEGNWVSTELPSPYEIDWLEYIVNGSGGFSSAVYSSQLTFSLSQFSWHVSLQVSMPEGYYDIDETITGSYQGYMTDQHSRILITMNVGSNNTYLDIIYCLIEFPDNQMLTMKLVGDSGDYPTEFFRENTYNRQDYYVFAKQ